ncbi:50S ribosomal protein L11 methyltransferase [Alistipes sp.]|uniref:50S ribosomal protein L11 methyltransferase n=1 Tax=Alistipes sp. TaxID=1872444 RepID=UPI003AF033E2
MNYIALEIACGEELAEVLTAFLADWPFESFQTADGVLKAYIPAAQLDACRTEVDSLLAEYGVAGRYALIETRNWNAPWESGFPPVEIDGRVRIRAPFHDPAPDGVLDIVLTPDMSFGTGHHPTTWLMTRALLELPLEGRCGLDAGSGTGVLAIVAAKRGAARVDAVDIDDRSCESCRRNAAANGVEERIETLLGDVDRVAGRRYDFIVANIHRNVLTARMPAYAAMLLPGGDLLLSGFYSDDVPAMVAAAEQAGLQLADTAEKEGWARVHVTKGADGL